jgi:RNA polymerase sigma-70 factor (ECF subfamily)
MPFDEAAFAAFYDHTARALWAFAYRATANAADADDIVSEAFCRLLQSADRLSTDEERRRYVFRIAGNLVVDRWRRQQRDEERDREQTAGMPDDARTVICGQVDDVTAGFARLSEHDRVLLWLAYVEGHSHAEIAAAVGVRKGSVKMLLSRARARLRRLLGTAVGVW